FEALNAALEERCRARQKECAARQPTPRAADRNRQSREVDDSDDKEGSFIECLPKNFLLPHRRPGDRCPGCNGTVERDIAQTAIADSNVKRLMTIPGIDMIVAVGVMAAIGRIDRFDSPDKLAAYIGSIQVSSIWKQSSLLWPDH